MSKKYYDPQYIYKEDKYYKLFEKEKENIKSKYPSHIFDDKSKTYTKQDRELHNQYLKELSDLIFAPNGYFQKMIWDTMAEVDKIDMERKARGRYTGTGEYH